MNPTDDHAAREVEIRQRIIREIKQLEQKRIGDHPDPTLFAAGVVTGLGMARAIIERGAQPEDQTRHIAKDRP